jgi:circadian clock protein KaiC
MSSHEFVQPLARFTSGVAGLDRVLDGGFFAGGVYIVEGIPGAGKTVLANQICFHHVKKGRHALYVTLLAESHARLLQHLQDLSFFDATVIPDRLTYVSGFNALENGGLKALLELVRKELRARSAGLVVLDGLAAVGDSADTDREFKKFVHELQVFAGLSSCTFFLLSSGTSAGPGAIQPVHTMVDGLIRLNDHSFGVRAERELQVQKFRGGRYLRGLHTFDITNDGIVVYPRLESFSADLADSSGPDRLRIGVKGLDAILHGGPLRGSTTMLLGPTGVGKTILGYHFLGCATANEKGLLFSFYETPKRALAKAEGVGLELTALCDRGDVELMWQSPVESPLDAIGSTLLEAVDRLEAKRLFIDGFSALQNSATYPERVPHFLAALGRELNARTVTTVYSAELQEAFAPEIESPVRGISPLVENLLLMRFLERRSELRRVLSVLKLRDSDFDAVIREFRITERGIEVGDGFPHTEAILTGVAHEEPKRAPEPAKVKKQTSKRARSTRSTKRRG